MSELTVIDLIKILSKRIWIILLTGIVCAGFMFTYTSFFVKPQYVASATILVKSNSDSQNNSGAILTDMNAAQRLVGTYSIVLKSNAAMHKLIDNYGVNYSVKQLQSMINLQAVEQSEVMRITVTGRNREDAIQIANAMLEIAPDILKEIVQVGNAKTVDMADDATKVSANVLVKTVMGFLVGAVLSAVVVLLLALMDQTIKDEDDITSRYNVSVLGSVPDFSASGKGGRK